MSYLARFAALLYCSVLALADVRAEEYSWEIAGVVSRSEIDPTIETDDASVFGTYYFDTVDDGDGPYALATFYDPAARMSVGAAHETQTLSTVSYATLLPILPLPSSVETDTDDYTLSGRYVLPDSRWYFGGRFAKRYIDDASLSATAFVEAGAKDYGVHFGKYLGPRTTLELDAGSSEERRETTNLFCISFIGCGVSGPRLTKTKTDNVSLEALHVRRFRGLTYSISGRVSQSSAHLELPPPAIIIVTSPPVFVPPPIFTPAPGTTTPAGGFLAAPLSSEISLGRVNVYSVGAEFFPTARIGVRIGYASFDSDDSFDASDYGYDVAVSWFITHHVGLQFGFARLESQSDLFEPTDTASVRMIGRF